MKVLSLSTEDGLNTPNYQFHLIEGHSRQYMYPLAYHSQITKLVHTLNIYYLILYINKS